MSLDLRRLRAPDVLIAAAGVGLIASLFVATWYGRGGLGTLDGWHTFSHLRWLLLVAGALAVGSAVLTATQRTPALPVGTVVLLFFVGLATVAWLVYRVLITRLAHNGFGDLDVGAWVGLVSGVALVAGSWLSMRDESPGRVPDPTDGPSVPREIRPAPPAHPQPRGGSDTPGEGPAPA